MQTFTTLLITIPSPVMAATVAMNEWEAEGYALRQEWMEMEPGSDEWEALRQRLQDRNWGDVAGDFAASLSESDAVEFRVGDNPDWLVAYNDQTASWEAIYAPDAADLERRVRSDLYEVERGGNPAHFPTYLEVEAAILAARASKYTTEEQDDDLLSLLKGVESYSTTWEE